MRSMVKIKNSIKLFKDIKWIMNKGFENISVLNL